MVFSLLMIVITICLLICSAIIIANSDVNFKYLNAFEVQRYMASSS